jgi:hypothetical protein
MKFKCHAMKHSVLVVAVIVCNFICCQSQAQKTTIDSLVGVWKGTSLCQVKNSPCHDEIVVYHISKGNTPDSCSVQANKIVNGVEEDMGILLFKIDKANDELISLSYNSKWAFKLKNGKLEGTLIHNNNLFRIIQLSKSK